MTRLSAESEQDIEETNIEIEMMVDTAASGMMTENTESVKTEIRNMDLMIVCMTTTKRPLHSEQRDRMLVETPHHQEAIILPGVGVGLDFEAQVEKSYFPILQIGAVGD
jgi:hypothetical protein